MTRDEALTLAHGISTTGGFVDALVRLGVLKLESSNDTDRKVMAALISIRTGGAAETMLSDFHAALAYHGLKVVEK